MNNENLGELAMDAFQQMLNVIILAIGNVLIILGEGCIAYVKDQGATYKGFDEANNLVVE